MGDPRHSGDPKHRFVDHCPGPVTMEHPTRPVAAAGPAAFKNYWHSREGAAALLRMSAHAPRRGAQPGRQESRQVLRSRTTELCTDKRDVEKCDKAFAEQMQKEMEA